MRLDKFLTEANIGTRSEVKHAIRKGMVQVNETYVKSPETKINTETDIIKYQGKILSYEKYVYYMLNKPAGVVSATKDNHDRTVIDLMKACNTKDLFPVGRLDKDTEGFLLLTNDGAFAHNILSPKKHVEKTYYALIDKPAVFDEIEQFQCGIDIKDDKPTLPAVLKVLSPEENETYLNMIETEQFKNITGYGMLVTITEGRYHQIKRMFSAFGQNVIYLKRLSMGNLILDSTLKTGQYKKLNENDLKLITLTIG